MTLKKSSRNPFASLLRNSLEKVLFVPILTLAIFLVYSTINVLDLIGKGVLNGYYKYEKVGKSNVGFFWDTVLPDPFTPILIILGGTLAALVLFSFAVSKKKCNVLFSLGLNRKDIFLAKYLGGIIPFAAAITISALLEIISNLICGYSVGLPTIHLALLSVTSMIAVYSLAFSITATALAFSGNIVEAGIFSLIIGAFPTMFGIFFGLMRGIFTHGGIAIYEGDWNFFNPFAASSDYIDYVSPIDYGYGSGDYLYRLYTGAEKITVYDWSGTLMALIYSTVILAIALLAFPKRRNEISGFFGRAKGLNEVCGAMAALYLSLLSLYATEDSRVRDITIFFAFMVTFAIGYLIFKFIFGYKRKKVMVRSLKRIAAYTIAFAVVTGIFSTGLFGYSSYVPDAKDVKDITISLELISPYADIDSDIQHDGDFGYTPMIGNNIPYYSNTFGLFAVGGTDYSAYYPDFTVYDNKEIKKVIEAHKSLAKDGKLRANADNVCGYGFMVDYTLRDGRRVRRYYSTASLESAVKLLGLSDLSEIKKNTEKYFYYDPDIMSEYDVSLFDNSFCLYSKDFKTRKYLEKLPRGFMNAVHTDIKQLTAQQIFFHKPEDELGIIVFTDESISKFLPIGEDEVVDGSGIIYNSETYDVTGNVSEQLEQFSAAKESNLLTALGKCIIVTKYMTNTVKYLNDNNLMQYFKSTVTADDVQRIKIATRAESAGTKNKDMLPLFASGYATAEYVKEKKDFRETQDHIFAQHVGGSITDKKIIQTVLDNAMLYGYNGNDDRVVEITYNDGSIATYAIKADVYNKLNIK